MWVSILRILTSTPNGMKFFKKDVNFIYYITFLLEDCNFDNFAIPKYMVDATKGNSIGESTAIILIMLIADPKSEVFDEIVTNPMISV